jgi:membrane protease YdiL (CAAX protease family)
LVFPIWLAAFGFVLGLHLLIHKGTSRTEVVLFVVDLMVTHLVAQELLFRGALVALAGRVWPSGGMDFGDVSGMTVLFTSLVFGFAQLQYNPTLYASAPWWQAFRAFVLGLVMVALRGGMRSIWASAAFHVFNNVIGALH